MCKACRIYRAEAELAAGNLRKAMFEARRARELQPDYDPAGFAEALTLIHLEQLEKASEILKKLRSRDRQSQAPSVELVQAMQGIVAHHLGKEKNAQQLLEGLSEPAARALLLGATGHPEQALEQLQEVPEWRSPEIEIFRYFLPEQLSGPRAPDGFPAILEGRAAAWGLNRVGATTSD